MDKLLRLVDVSLVTTIVSGLLYVMGYKYFFHYYTYFGINLLVRDPEVVYVITKGFEYSGYLFIAMLLLAVVYMATTHISAYFLRESNSQLHATAKLISIVASLYAFNLGFSSLLDRIHDDAIKNAELLAKGKASKKASIVLQDGNILPGKFSFFFLNEKYVVLFNTSTTTNTNTTNKPKLTIIPSANVRLLEVN